MKSKEVKRKVVIIVRLSQELKAQAEEVARLISVTEHQTVSLSEVVRRALAEYVRRGNEGAYQG